MALYLKRLIVRRIEIGIAHPSMLANKIYNPVLQYLNDQYNLVSAGETPRGASFQLARDGAGTGNIATEDWNSYWDEALRQFAMFKSLVDGFKNNEISLSDQQAVQSLYQAGDACAQALCNDYMLMVIVYLSVTSGFESGTRGGVLDDPTSAYFHWTDYLNPFNWGKSPYQIESEKLIEQEEWKNRLKHEKIVQKEFFRQVTKMRIAEITGQEM